MRSAVEQPLVARSPVGPQPSTPVREHAGRNPGIPLDVGRLAGLQINRSAIERRAATLPTRRTVKQQWQAPWLLRAISCLDLTTLSGDDTPGTVRRLCAKARQPVRADLLESLGVAQLDLHVGAVCVYHNPIAPAVEALRGSGSNSVRSRRPLRRFVLKYGGPRHLPTQADAGRITH